LFLITPHLYTTTLMVLTQTMPFAGSVWVDFITDALRFTAKTDTRMHLPTGRKPPLSSDKLRMAGR